MLGKAYKSFIEINFLEKPDLIPIFSGNIGVAGKKITLPLYMSIFI